MLKNLQKKGRNLQMIRNQDCLKVEKDIKVYMFKVFKRLHWTNSKV